MATIGPVQVIISANGVDKLDFNMRYNITFNAFDTTTDLFYSKTYVFIGIDTPAVLTGPPADPATAGGNDTMATVSMGFVNFSTGGNPLLVSDTITLSRATVDEDKPPIPNPDELQVRVELRPVLPTPTSRTSGIAKIDLP